MKCTFCGYEIERGTGKIKFMKDERVVHLCSMKCEKNMFKLGRLARELPWTAEYKVFKDMRMGTEKKAEKAPEIKKEAKTAKKVK